MYLYGDNCEVIICFYVTDFKICNVFTLDDIVFLEYASISFHWLVPQLICLFKNKKKYTRGKTPTTAWVEAPLPVGFHPHGFARWCRPKLAIIVGLDTLNTLRPRQNGGHFPDDIFKCIFLNENIWISLKISLNFVPNGRIDNIPALVQIMAWHRPGDKPLSEPMIVSLPTHICVTRPQWVNHCRGVTWKFRQSLLWIYSNG